MAKVLFEVDVRQRAALYDKLVSQQPLRAAHGEIAFSMHIDDNARHIAYVFLDWESLRSAQQFLNSAASRVLVADWPIERVLGAIPLKNFADTYVDDRGRRLAAN